MTYLVLTFKLVFFTGAIILLLVALLKLSDGKLKGLTKGKYIKVIEKTPLSKNSSLYLLKLGDEAVVVLTNEKGADKIKDLSKEEIEKIEREKEMATKEFNKNCNEKFNSFKFSTVAFLKGVKGEKDEK